MKVAVYSISKNEAKHIARWAESAKDADLIILADTGSTDDTTSIAEEHGVEVHTITVNPWRFDEARNKSLEFIPEDYDYCIALDVDEVLMPGWREELEKMLAGNVTRPRYKYVWSWKDDGSEGLTYFGDKIHARKNYVWRHPVHEVITCTAQEIQSNCGIEIHHHPDRSKSRGHYLDLLKLSVEEDPMDDRNAYYYARELYFRGRHEEAAEEFKRHLALPTARWRAERSRGMRYLAEIEQHDRETWLLRAAGEAPERREPWVGLAQYYYEQSRWQQCLASAERALEIKHKPLEYLCEEFAWDYHTYDYAAIACYRLGLYDKALKYGRYALGMNPGDERLKKNIEYYLEGVNHGDK